MLNFFGPVNSLGTGVHCYNMAKSYEEMGGEVCLIPPLGQVRFEDENVARWLRNRERFNVKDPSVMIFDVAWLSQFSGTPRIGFAVFETDGFSRVQLAAMKSCDHVLTPSEWGRRVLAANGIEASVVREGLNPAKFPLDLRLGDEWHVFRALHVGKFEERKGTIQTIRCFFLALEREDAELVMHCENPFMDGGGYNQIAQELHKLGFAPAGFASGRLPNVFKRAGLKVTISGPTLSIAHLYRWADVGIFPSKGEGWGLPILECIASGTPAIAGNWTGQSEFMGEDYPEKLTIQAPYTEIANDGVWYFGDRGRWNCPRDAELVELIRWAYDNAWSLRKSPEWADRVCRMRNEFTWRRAAAQLDSFVRNRTVDCKK